MPQDEGLYLCGAPSPVRVTIDRRLCGPDAGGGSVSGPGPRLSPEDTPGLLGFSTLLHRSPSPQCRTWARGGAVGGRSCPPPSTPCPPLTQLRHCQRKGSTPPSPGGRGGVGAVQGWPWPRAPQRRRHGGVGPHTRRPFMTPVPSPPPAIHRSVPSSTFLFRLYSSINLPKLIGGGLPNTLAVFFEF